MVPRILVRDGASPKAMGMFYKACVQAVLLYGSETWSISPRMLSALRGLHHRAARRISDKQPYLVNDEWVYPPIKEALKGRRICIRSSTIWRRVGTNSLTMWPLGQYLTCVLILKGLVVLPLGGSGGLTTSSSCVDFKPN